MCVCGMARSFSNAPILGVAGVCVCVREREADVSGNIQLCHTHN